MTEDELLATLHDLYEDLYNAAQLLKTLDHAHLEDTAYIFACEVLERWFPDEEVTE